MSNESDRGGRLFVVAAPSGAGKTSLVNALVADDPKLVISVSYTTRPPRPGEKNGIHYHFVSEAAFEQRREAGEFLEHAEVFGHRYGTHRQTTEAILETGQDVLLEIDWQGARQIKRSFPDARSVFILPPSVEALRERLGHRAQDSEEVIDRRMAEARAELSHCAEFDFVVVNDDFATALEELRQVIAHCRGETIWEQAPYALLLAELLENG